MPQPYSNDLRRKFFQVYDAGEGTLEEIAKRFRVSLSWAKKISARRTKTGEIEVREWRREQIRRQPDLTLQELQQRLEQGPRLRLSLGWIWVVVRQLGLRLKKSRSTRKSRTVRRRSSAGKPGGNRSP